MTRRATAIVPRRRRAFTLVELIVVMGIIAVLAALVLPMIGSVTTQADRAAQRAALASIEQALEAYQGDFGDVPRFAAVGHPSGDPEDGAALNNDTDRGARLLARALFGPAPKLDPDLEGEPVDSVTQEQLLAAFQDGVDDFGTRGELQVVTDPQTGTPHFFRPGKNYGPYLEPERWRLSVHDHDADPDTDDQFWYPTAILDRNDKPVLYYPALARTPDIYADENFVDSTPSFVLGQTPTRQGSLYNSYDNRGRLDERTLRIMLGDLHDEDPYPDDELLKPENWTPNGQINEYEEAAMTGPFLLIASDDTGEYSQGSVANFEPAAQGVDITP